MLLQLSTLSRSSTDHYERAVPELHVPQSNVNVLPEGVPLLESDRSGLYGRETTGPVLSSNHMSRGTRATAHLDHDEFTIQDIADIVLCPASAARRLGFVLDRTRLPRHLWLQCQ